MVNSMVNLLPDTSKYMPQMLRASDCSDDDGFGTSLEIVDDTTLLIGSSSASAGGVRSGAVYIFKRNKAGKWKEVSKVVSPTRGDGSGFGSSIANLHGVLMIGAPAQSNTGEVFIDSVSLFAAPGAAEDPVVVDSPSRGYGDKNAFFDTVPHALVSSLLFFVLPTIALATIIYGRRPIVDYVSNSKWKFNRLEEGEGHEEDGGGLLGQRRVFVHDNDKRPNPLIADLEETHGLIRV